MPCRYVSCCANEEARDIAEIDASVARSLTPRCVDHAARGCRDCFGREVDDIALDCDIIIIQNTKVRPATSVG